MRDLHFHTMTSLACIAAAGVRAGCVPVFFVSIPEADAVGAAEAEAARGANDNDGPNPGGGVGGGGAAVRRAARVGGAVIAVGAAARAPPLVPKSALFVGGDFARLAVLVGAARVQRFALGLRHHAAVVVWAKTAEGKRRLRPDRYKNTQTHTHRSHIQKLSMRQLKRWGRSDGAVASTHSCGHMQGE